jgi:hypothetical protein
MYSQNKIYNSILKYGWDQHTFDIIEECKFEELNIRERYWQDYYNVLSKNGLNCILTQTNELPYRRSEKINEIIKNKNKGKKRNDETKLKMSLASKNKPKPHLNKPVIQYDLNWNYIREWENGIIATKSLGYINDNSSVSSCCRNKQKTAFGFRWRFKGDTNIHDNTSYKKEIIQYDLKGNFIREWKSIAEASLSLFQNITKNSGINSCCRNKIRKSFGFIWRYKTNPLPKNFKLSPHKSCKSIIQYSLKGEYIKDWGSIKEACLNLNMDEGTITSHLKGRQKTAYGFKWKYKINLAL